jgi:solute carrier family 25 (mitochondrial phosphate transporter), member 23/24/25/41
MYEQKRLKVEDWLTIRQVGLNFMTYESVRKWFTKDGEKTPSATRRLAAGAISGAVAQTCTYPLYVFFFHFQSNWSQLTQKFSSDVLRRRFQINTMSGMGYQYKSIWDAISIIVSQEGIRGLYKGIVPNLLKVAPSMASSWLSFELTRDFLVGLGKIEE